MAIQVSSDISLPIRNLLFTLLSQMGSDASGVDVSDKEFKIILESPNGKNLFATLQLGTGGAFQLDTTRLAAGELDVPRDGGADLDASFGTATLADSLNDVTVPALLEGGDPVPSDAVLYAFASTRAGVVASLKTERLSSTVFRIASLGNSYPELAEVDVEEGINSAGTIDITMDVAVNVGDLFAVDEISTGGDAADHFSAHRESATEITIQAHDAAGALVGGNTSVVRAHNFGPSLNPSAEIVGTLVAGLADLTLTQAAGDLLVAEEVTAGGTAANHFSVHRDDGTTVTVQAHDDAGALVAGNTSIVRVKVVGAPKSTVGTCASGLLDAPLASAVGDRLSAVELVTGGGAADHFSVHRDTASQVTVQAHDAGGALVGTNSSIVQIYNHGQPAQETSVASWVVRRQ